MAEYPTETWIGAGFIVGTALFFAVLAVVVFSRRIRRAIHERQHRG